MKQTEEDWPEGFGVTEPDDVVHVSCTRCRRDIAIFSPLTTRQPILDAIQKHIEATHHTNFR